MADTPGRAPMPETVKNSQRLDMVRFHDLPKSGRMVSVSTPAIHDPAIIRAIAATLVAGAAWVEDGQRAERPGEGR